MVGPLTRSRQPPQHTPVGYTLFCLIDQPTPKGANHTLEVEVEDAGLNVDRGSSDKGRHEYGSSHFHRRYSSGSTAAVEGTPDSCGRAA